MHEALASPGFQSVPVTAPSAMLRDVAIPSAEDQLQKAQRLLREAVSCGAPPEAFLRLGRVTGRLGKHADAVAVLERVVPPAGDGRFEYFRDLFLGTELGALGRFEAARAALERAAARFPTAQSPLIALSDVCRRSGDRSAALAAVRRLQALPAEPSERTDPWRHYHRSYVEDADSQLAAIRAWVDRKEPR
jgi:hypothetical protein